MPKFLLITLGIFLLIGCSNHKTTINWRHKGLRGRVKLVKEKRYRAEAKKKSKKWRKKTILSYNETVFNDKGSLLEKKSFDKNEKLSLKIIYNTNQNKVQELCFYDKKNILLNKEIIEESTSKKIKARRFVKDEIYSGYEEFYGKYGITKSISYSYWDNKKSLYSTITYKYDKKGYLISKNTVGYPSHYNVIRYKYLKFDKKGNWLKRLTFIGTSSELWYFTIRKYEYF